MNVSPPNFKEDDINSCLSWLEAELSKVVQLEDGTEKAKSGVRVHAYYERLRSRIPEFNEGQKARMTTLIELILTEIFDIPLTTNNYIIEIEGADVRQVEEAARDLAEKIDREGEKNWRVTVTVRDEKTTSSIAEWRSGVDDG